MRVCEIENPESLSTVSKEAGFFNLLVQCIISGNAYTLLGDVMKNLQNFGNLFFFGTSKHELGFMKISLIFSVTDFLYSRKFFSGF
ncbi:MAG: hypothetical protein ACD_76C00044G0031 [uncultured bacterium]|nr:MAG: hypothetical protein ACD_76C00044G0031 [uncultured bacterium]